MKTADLIVFTGLCALIVCYPCEESYGAGTPPARSILQAKRTHSFVESVAVTPNSFHLDGHVVDVAECWLQEKPGLNPTIAFRLLVDGRPERRGSKAVYIEPPAKDQWSNFAGMGKSIFFAGLLRHHETIVHQIAVRKPLPDSVSVTLRLGSSASTRSTLTFKLAQ